MKKIITVARVKNESDIIESFCRYNLTYCDCMLINDNGSIDNTKKIIEELINEGLPIIYIDTGIKTEMARIAIDEYNADLVVPLDADEFLYHVDGINPREALEELREDVEYQIPWRTYVCDREPVIEVGFLPNNYLNYRNPALECRNKALVSRYLLKEKQASYASGGHYLLYPVEHQTPSIIERPSKLVFTHYPIRSKGQLLGKVIPNWIYKWKSPFPVREGLGFQLGKIWDDLLLHGEVSREIITRHCIIYSADEHILSKVMPEIENNLIIEGVMDTGGCADRLELRYTDYSDTDRTFIRSTLSEVELALASLPKREWETIRLLERTQHENKSLVQHLGELDQHIIELGYHINKLNQESDNKSQHINTLDQHIIELGQRIKALEQETDEKSRHISGLDKLNTELNQQISGILGSNTWKAGKRLQKVFRVFIPNKTKNKM